MKFDDVLATLKSLHDKKGADYNHSGPYSNVRGSTEWGVPAWIGAMIRANDKIRRLQKYAHGHSLANESAEDSFKDLAIYVIIAYILWQEENAKLRNS